MLEKILNVNRGKKHTCIKLNKKSSANASNKNNQTKLRLFFYDITY